MKLSKLLSKIVILSVLCATPLYAERPRLIEQEPKPGAMEWVTRSLFPVPVKLIQNDGQLVISGSDPREKVKIANEIRIWLNAPVANFDKVDWTKDINVTPMINPKLKKFHVGNPLPVNGINCHGTSLYLSGLIKRLTYVGESELKFYLSNHCEEVSSPVANAIGVYEKEIDSHSYKIVGPGLTFQKGSVGRTTPFKFMLIRDYGPSKFFICKPAKEEFCSKHRDLKLAVDNLDELYNGILEHGLGIQTRDILLDEIGPLAARVEQAIQVEAYPYCQQDLLKLRYRLDSLQSIGNAILGKGLFRNIDKFPVL